MEENSKAIVRRLLERVVGAGDESAVDELIHPDCQLHHSAAPGGALYGRSLAAEVLCSYARAFPNLKPTIETLLSEGEDVAARYSWHGTQQGKFVGRDPSTPDCRHRSLNWTRGTAA